MNIPCFKNPISNIWVVFYKADINHMFSFSLGAYSVEEELLSHRLQMFNFIGNCQTIFQNCFNILHSYWECMRVPVVLRHHYLTLSVFQFLLMQCVLGYFTVGLIFISLVIEDVEHCYAFTNLYSYIFFCELTIQFFSSFKKLFSIIYVLNINPWSDLCSVNVFSQSMTCLFIFLMVSLDRQMFVILTV